MYLFIFESIGTAELALIGIVALMFLGPRKLPEYAKKIGKMMADFRSTTGDFKETWQREVNFEEEVKAMRLDDLDESADEPVARMIPEREKGEKASEIAASPEIKQIDPERFKEMQKAAESELSPVETEPGETPDDKNDKKNWL